MTKNRTDGSSSPEQLLFTFRDGRRGQLQDIIDEGLDGGYEDRLPALVALAESGEPAHRLWACMMLVAWGHPKGFETLVQWASNPEQVPWHDNPVTFDRISGSDAAFESLADALRTSYYCAPSEALASARARAARALLGLSHAYLVGEALALAIARDSRLAAAVQDALRAAVDRGLQTLREEPPRDFELAYQIASLLMALAPLDDPSAADYADQLMREHAGSGRMLGMLADALGEGTGAATLASLEWMESRFPAVSDHVRQVLARRRARPGA